MSFCLKLCIIAVFRVLKVVILQSKSTNYQHFSINTKTMTNKSSKSTIVQITPSTISPGTSSCHNLQQSRNGKSLVPSPLPHEIIKGNYTPFHHFTHHNGITTIFLLSGNSLAIINHDGSTFSSPTEITTLPSMPHCGVNTRNSVYLMTDAGAYRIDYDANSRQWIDLGLMPQFPGIKIMATTTADFSVATAPFTLSGSYPHWQGSLNKADQQLLTSTLLNAYSSLQNDALTAGFFIQPVMARYHLLDADDNLLFSSSPVLVSVPTGFQCVNQITLTTNDFTTINSATLYATGFQIGVEAESLNGSPWAEVIANVVIEATPILDPVNTKTLAQCRLNSTSTTSGEIKAFMPGTSITMVASTVSQERLITNAISSFSAIATPLTRIAMPFLNGITKTGIPPQSIVGNAITISPFRFSARTSAQSGDTVFWGNIARLRPYAPAIGNIVASTNNGSGFWRAFVSVKFHNSDDIIVWNGEGENGCPSTISPLLIYPQSDACEMTIGISCGSKIVRKTFPLTPLSGTDFAYYLHSSLAPFAITDEAQAFIIPSQFETPCIKWGEIAVAHTSQPLLLTTSQQISEGEIKVITPAVKSSSSWDFARTHAYTFTTAGIFATSVNVNRTKISAHIIDNRKIATPQSVAFANDSVYAIASGDLISISGAKASTLINSTGITSLAWHNASHLLLCTTDENYMILFDTVRNLKSTCDAPANSYLYNCPEAPLLYNNVSLYVMQALSSATVIKWCHTIIVPNPRQRVSLASFMISASQFSGTIAIRCHGGAGNKNSYPITTLNIKGAINAPIPMRIIAPPRPYITITIDSNTSSDFELQSIQLMFQ